MPAHHVRHRQSVSHLTYSEEPEGVVIVVEEYKRSHHGRSQTFTMPYAEPTSPIPSPVKETTSSRKGWLTPPSHIEDTEAGPSGSTGPMLGVPRRQSSTYSTPRRGSPALSRTSSASPSSFTVSRPMEGLPRRMSNPGGPSSLGVSGLPTDGGSLGLKLLPSPTKPAARPTTRANQKDSMSSMSTLDNSLPPTPADEPLSLPVSLAPIDSKNETTTLPSFAPPPRGTMPGRSAMSPRPTLSNSGRQRSYSPAAAHLHPPHRPSHAHSGSLQINIASSSAAQLTNVPGSSSESLTMPRPASMIRKKSGEVVKPSLKLRSMSTPDLSRQGDGYPSTPEEESERGFPEERSKSVRFAGADEADGGELENVVLFLREQKPAAVGRAADPDAGPYTETETENDTDIDFVQFRTRRNAAARAADGERLVMDGGSKVPRVRLDFSPETKDILKDEYVVLERSELVHDAGPLQLKGTVLVRNMSFQKWVAIRFTMDHWQTVSEVSGQHVTHVPSETTGDEGWDRFSFSVKLEDYRRKLEERQLMLCIRFSVDGREWWDSNNGLNYNFTFKKATPRRSRMSGPPAYAAGFKPISADESVVPVPGLRQNRATNPASAQIKKAFGTGDDKATAGPRHWTFPRLATQIHAAPPRPESPVSRPPPESFVAPSRPDVLSHLSLSKYCAPSPPTSPPRDAFGQLPAAPPTVVSPESDLMNVFAGGYATLSPPITPPKPGHERRSSWNGQVADGWTSFSQALSNDDTPQATDGEVTPVALRSRSPHMMDSSSDSSPERRPLSMKRSTGNLRALLTDDSSTLSPPSSNLSSPPSPCVGLPDTPLSPSVASSASTSTTSTGDSSPNTVDSDSALDLANLAISIDPEEQRGRPLPQKMLSNSYQEFLDKFCFFQSPRMTPNEEPVFPRPTYLAGSGTASPNGFPFFATNSSSSPRSTPTPTRQYDSASDAFTSSSATATPPLPVNGYSNGPRKGETGIISGPGNRDKDGASQITPKGSPLPGSSPAMSSASGPLAPYALGHPMSDKWAMRQGEASPQFGTVQ